MRGSTGHSLMLQTSVCVLILAMAFVGINIGVPAAIPPAHGQTINGVVGTILGLAVIAGVVYLITRDRNGVYSRYPYGQYDSNGYGANRVRYRYNGPYAEQYRTYQGRWYSGPMPRAWNRDRGCYGGQLRSDRCM
ncbi:MAG TPA: hypothetical protein VKW09_07390 [bacterium]|nr:hypothetical protein [bacterium]